MNAEELYQEVIMDHASRPRNFGALADADVRVEAENPMCGDEITLYLKMGDGKGKVERAQFTGQACAICTASASMLTTKVRGLERAEALRLSNAFQGMIAGRDACGGEERLGDLKALEGVRKFPMRVKCATLAWHALDQAIEQADQGGGRRKIIEE